MRAAPSRRWLRWFLSVAAGLGWALDGATAAAAKSRWQPLGGHRPPTGTVTELDDFPDPQTFFHNHAAASVPFVVRGGGLKLHPASTLWTDDYLMRTFGKVVVEWEEGKKENRSLDVFHWRLKRFIQKYRTLNGYCVWDVNGPMKGNLQLPTSLACGGFHRRLSTAIMWFSGGGTASVLHKDIFENINCVLDGAKTFIMINRTKASLMESERAGWSPMSSSAPEVDVDAVDLERFPNLGEFDYTVANVATGDCLYIPAEWYHQVRSSRSRSLAVNVWFYPMTSFDAPDCIDGDRMRMRTRATLSSFQWLPPDREEANPADSVAAFAATEFQIDGFGVSESHLERVLTQGALPPTTAQIFREMDANGDGLVTVDELSLEPSGDDDSLYFRWQHDFHWAWRLASHVNRTMEIEIHDDAAAPHTEL